MGTIVCETIAGGTMAELLSRREAATEADVVELRLDGIVDLDVARALRGRRTPAVVTCRPRWEGGRFEGSEAARRAILDEAAQCGAEFVDVEWNAEWRASFVPGGSRLIVSWHGAEPARQIGERLVEMRRAVPGAIVKVATTTRDLEAVGALRQAVAGAERADGEQVVIGMGREGLLTRVCPWLFGSAWTYGGPSVAPGQIPLADLVVRYRVRSGSPNRVVVGVAGPEVPAEAVASRATRCLAESGRDAVCVPLGAPAASNLARLARTLGLAGCVDVGTVSEHDRVVGDIVARWGGLA
jgi:3-dehydroquinate dehydratase/shikimate dehydrogenase